MTGITPGYLRLSFINIIYALIVSAEVKMESDFSLLRNIIMGSPNRRKTIVLIGSTGSGKSTLGNCLLEPSKTSGPKVFASGCGRMPQTQQTQVGVSHCSRGAGKPPIPLKIIDTPGPNESAAKDQAHMIEIETAVRKESKIAACLLCVKFNSQIDIQYKTTVQMYKQLLPGLFEANLIVVFTDYSEHPRAMKKRRREGIVPNVVMRNALDAIVEAAELSYVPKYFCIDSLPTLEDDHCIECTMAARRAIIEHIDTLMSVWTGRCTVS